VLFLDELPEFDRRVLEVLRQPLEEGSVAIARALRTVRFPARFLLVAAMNPCPCGYRGHARRVCRCTPQQIARYGSRVSGPLRDRIDLALDVPALDVTELHAGPAEASDSIRGRVCRARMRQAGRSTLLNAEIDGAAARQAARLDAAGRRLLGELSTRLALSARAHDRVLKVARTIADLVGDDAVTAEHLAEAFQFRGPP
jgi:magnesium chelatase family protein